MRKTVSLVTLVALAAAAPALAGVSFSSVTTVEGMKGAEKGNMTVHGWAEGDRAKIQFVQSQNPMLKAGSYLLTLDGGQTIYLVDPKEKTFTKWDVDAIVDAAGSVMQGTGGLLSMTFSDPKVERLGDDDGGTVAGLPTRHYRFRTSYSSEMKIMGMQKTSSTVLDEELWVAPSLAEAGLGIWLRKDPKKTGNEGFDKLMAASQAKYEGFPLKHVTVNTTTDKKGNATVTKTTVTVTELEVTDVPASNFTMGSGYREKPMLPMAGKPGEQPAGGEDEPQQDQQYPFDQMLDSSQQADAAAKAAPGAKPATDPAKAGWVVPAQPPQQPDTPPADPPADEPYPFELMLDN